LRVFIFILFVFISVTANSQEYYCENITSGDGLPNNAIRSIFQDSRGFIWIGTDAGVSKWDGDSFITYNTLDGLIGNKVWWIEEDNEHNLWFACYSAGISRFDGQKFVSYTDKDGLTDNYVRVIKYSSYHDCMAIGTNKALSVLKDSTFYNFNVENKSIRKEVIITGILENDSCIEFYDFSSMHQWVFFKDKKPYIKTSGFDFFGKVDVSSVFEAENGDKYVGWGREGVILKNKSGLQKIPDIGQVFGIAEDCFKDIWIASWNGGISPPGGLFILQDDKMYSLNGEFNLESILGWATHYVNKQNIVLYGTLDMGLFKIPTRLFEYYRPEYFKESNFIVKDIEVDKDNNIWFLSDSLLVFWDKNSYKKISVSEFIRVKYQYEINKNGKVSADTKSKKSNKNYTNAKPVFSDIEFDSKNTSWVSVDRLGLFRISHKYNHFIISFIGYVSSNFVFDDSDRLFQSNMWTNYILKFSDFEKSNEVFTYSDSLHPVFAKNIFSYKNEVWANSRIEGIFMHKDGEFRTITSEDSSINKIVNDICFDTKGNAYLGGNDGRIEVLESKAREKIFEINHEEFNNSVHWLNISRDRLFVGFSDGLRVYKLEDLKNRKTNYRFFGEKEGFFVDVVNGSVVDNEGDIWLATNDGLLKIKTELFIECDFQPLTTIIQKVELFNKNTIWEQYVPIDFWSGLPLETPNLNSDENHISIYFHTLNYNNPDADNYYYKLDGLDKNWIGPTNKKYVVYPYLNSGKYRFLVKSKNGLSGLFTPTAEFEFVILTPWYKQIWFYIFLAILVIFFFVIFYTVRLRSIRKKEERKRYIMQKISELENKALQAQMNPHFLFNSINSIQNYILDNEVDEALTYLSSFSKIIRKTLEFVNNEFVSLSEVIDYLQNYVLLENMRFDDLFDFIIECDEEIDMEVTLIPPMLLQPIIENSIKHGIMQLQQKGIIKLIIIKAGGDSYKCIVEDNGVGRVMAAKLHAKQKLKEESYGLKITKERLGILNAKGNGYFGMKIIDLFSEKGQPTGTRVEITLALSQ